MRAISIGLLCLIAIAPVRSENSSRSLMPTLLYTVTKHYDTLGWMRGEDRFSGDTQVFIWKAGGRHALAPSFAESADPAVSFDEKKILFAGKRTIGMKWQIWEMPLEGGEPKQLTNCPGDCVRPFYLPEGRIVYAERVGGRFVIQAQRVDGAAKLALSYGPANALPTDVLADGRVLFEASFPLGENGGAELYTVYSDGSGVESYRCDHGGVRHSGRQISSGDVVFANQFRLMKFTSARAAQFPLTVPDGEYAGDLAESSSREWLLPWRANQKGRFALMAWKPGEVKLRTVVEERDSDVAQPVVVAARPVPKRHPSGLHDWPVANLLCLNAYTSKYSFTDQSIRSVRFYTKDASGHAELLGSAPVERDGSFFVQVKGDEPIQIELVDAAGETLQREAGWFWLRRGEQRACVGCHAGPETAPENAVPMVLLRSTTPADMTGAKAGSGGH